MRNPVFLDKHFFCTAVPQAVTRRSKFLVFSGSAILVGLCKILWTRYCTFRQLMKWEGVCVCVNVCVGKRERSWKIMCVFSSTGCNWHTSLFIFHWPELVIYNYLSLVCTRELGNRFLLCTGRRGNGVEIGFPAHHNRTWFTWNLIISSGESTKYFSLNRNIPI